MIEFVSATVDDISKWHYDYLTEGNPDAAMIIILFGGDRLYCLRNGGGGFFAKDGEKIVGCVSYSPTGEYEVGPGIIGLWVDRPYRRRQWPGTDLAQHLLILAIEALRPCLNDQNQKIRVDIISGSARSVLKRLDARYQVLLDVHDFDRFDYSFKF